MSPKTSIRLTVNSHSHRGIASEELLVVHKAADRCFAPPSLSVFLVVSIIAAKQFCYKDIRSGWDTPSSSSRAAGHPAGWEELRLLRDLGVGMVSSWVRNSVFFVRQAPFTGTPPLDYDYASHFRVDDDLPIYRHSVIVTVGQLRSHGDNVSPLVPHNCTRG